MADKVVGKSTELSQKAVRKLKLGILVVKLAYLISFSFILISHIQRKWEILAMYAGTACFYQLQRMNIFHKNIPNERLRSNFIFVVALLPFFAFVAGKTEAVRMQSGISYTYITSEIEGFDSKKYPKIESQLRLIGKGGDFIFLYNPITDSSMMMKVGDDKPLIFKKHSLDGQFSLITLTR